MECPNCHNANEEGNKFCISCGAPLTPPQEESSSEVTEEINEPDEAAPVDLQTLHSELRSLRDDLGQMNRRVVAFQCFNARSTRCSPPPMLYSRHQL